MRLVRAATRATTNVGHRSALVFDLETCTESSVSATSYVAARACLPRALSAYRKPRSVDHGRGREPSTAPVAVTYASKVEPTS